MYKIDIPNIILHLKYLNLISDEYFYHNWTTRSLKLIVGYKYMFIEAFYRKTKTIAYI